MCLQPEIHMIARTRAHEGVCWACWLGCIQSVQDTPEDVAGGLEGHAVDGQ